jgi:hypothetical protein
MPAICLPGKMPPRDRGNVILHIAFQVRSPLSRSTSRLGSYVTAADRILRASCPKELALLTDVARIINCRSTERFQIYFADMPMDLPGANPSAR